MKSRRTLLIVLAVVFGALVLTNPSESQYRGHIQERQGIVGTLGMGLADLLSGAKGGGIHRDNYLICSRYYVGGDGILPRQNLAWGIAGMFFESSEADLDHELHRNTKRY